MGRAIAIYKATEKAKNRNKKIKSDEFTGSHRRKSNIAKNHFAF